MSTENVPFPYFSLITLDANDFKTSKDIPSEWNYIAELKRNEVHNFSFDEEIEGFERTYVEVNQDTTQTEVEFSSSLYRTSKNSSATVYPILSLTVPKQFGSTDVAHSEIALGDYYGDEDLDVFVTVYDKNGQILGAYVMVNANHDSLNSSEQITMHYPFLD